MMVLSMNVAWATDNTTQDSLTVISQDILADSAETATFTELQNYINSKGHVDFNKSYAYDSTQDNIKIVEITREGVVVDGKGMSIDGCNQAAIFKITAKNVVLNNITFKNSNGTAVHVTSTSSNTVINNSFFVNNSVTDQYGGAVRWEGDNGTISNSKFENNVAKAAGNLVTEYFELFGGYHQYKIGMLGCAVYWDGANGKVIRSVFNSNHDSYDEDAIQRKVSTFNNLSSDASDWWKKTAQGAAVYWNGANGTVESSNFTNNSVQYVGGAVFWNGKNGTVKFSNFTNSSSKDSGGAILIYSENFKIFGSNFYNCSSKALGGAIGIEDNETSIDMCKFINNTAKPDDLIDDGGTGGAISMLGHASKFQDKKLSGTLPNLKADPVQVSALTSQYCL